jgi:hypothetical protein
MYGLVFGSRNNYGGENGMKIVFEKGENPQKITETLEILYFCVDNVFEPKLSREDEKKARKLLDKIQTAMEVAQ